MNKGFLRTRWPHRLNPKLEGWRPRFKVRNWLKQSVCFKNEDIRFKDKIFFTERQRTLRFSELAGNKEYRWAVTKRLREPYQNTQRKIRRTTINRRLNFLQNSLCGRD